MTQQRSTAVGYSGVAEWAKLPAGWSWTEVAGIATDSRDRVFVFNRGAHPVMIFDRDGTFIDSWGEGVFVRPHGITIGPDDTVYCSDDQGHNVSKFTPEGRLLLSLGSGQPSETGATSMDYRSIQQSAGPFHYPTNLALAGDGSMYVTDGYGNARVHKFSAEGKLLFSWGEPGAGPGQFHLPHGIAIDPQGIVYVADRENSRVQRFDAEGKFLGEWKEIARPCQVFYFKDHVYVAELGYRAGMWPGTSAAEGATGGRVSVFNRKGKLQARWGGGERPCDADDFYAPHSIWVDSHGDVYVGEVTWSAGGSQGKVPAHCPSLRKFVRG